MSNLRLDDRNSESDSVTNEDSSDNNIGPSSAMSATTNHATTNNHHHNNTTTVHHESVNNTNHIPTGLATGSIISVTSASSTAMSAAVINKNAGKNQLQISETLIAGGLGRNLPKKK